MKSLLLSALFAAAFASAAGCCSDCACSKPKLASPRVEEYPLPPIPPDTRLK